MLFTDLQDYLLILNALIHTQEFLVWGVIELPMYGFSDLRIYWFILIYWFITRRMPGERILLVGIHIKTILDCCDTIRNPSLWDALMNWPRLPLMYRSNTRESSWWGPTRKNVPYLDHRRISLLWSRLSIYRLADLQIVRFTRLQLRCFADLLYVIWIARLYDWDTHLRRYRLIAWCIYNTIQAIRRHQ